MVASQAYSSQLIDIAFAIHLRTSGAIINGKDSNLYLESEMKKNFVKLIEHSKMILSRKVNKFVVSWRSIKHILSDKRNATYFLILLYL